MEHVYKPYKQTITTQPGMFCNTVVCTRCRRSRDQKSPVDFFRSFYRRHRRPEPSIEGPPRSSPETSMPLTLDAALRTPLLSHFLERVLAFGSYCSCQSKLLVKIQPNFWGLLQSALPSRSSTPSPPQNWSLLPLCHEACSPGPLLWNANLRALDCSSRPPALDWAGRQCIHLCVTPTHSIWQLFKHTCAACLNRARLLFLWMQINNHHNKILSQASAWE